MEIEIDPRKQAQLNLRSKLLEKAMADSLHEVARKGQAVKLKELTGASNGESHNRTMLMMKDVGGNTSGAQHADLVSNTVFKVRSEFMQDFLDINNLPAAKSFCNMLPRRPDFEKQIDDRDILDYLKHAKVDLFTNVKELKDSVIRHERRRRSNSQNNQMSVGKYIGSVEGHSGTSFKILG